MTDRAARISSSLLESQESVSRSTSPARWPRERCRAWTCSRTWGEDLSPGVAQSRSCAL